MWHRYVYRSVKGNYKGNEIYCRWPGIHLSCWKACRVRNWTWPVGLLKCLVCSSSVKSCSVDYKCLNSLLMHQLPSLCVMAPSQHNNYCNIESIMMVQRTTIICNLCCKDVIRNKGTVILTFCVHEPHICDTAREAICIKKFMFTHVLIPVSTWCKVHMILECLNTGITGSNPVWGMDVCLCFSLLCCPV